MMNTTGYLVASLALFVAVSASAQDAASSPSRADVKAQGQAAMKAGESPVGDVENKPDTSGKSTKTRAQVKGEAASAAKAGQIPQGETGARPRDVNPSKYGASAGHSSKTRAQVKGEATSAARSGQMKTGDLDTNSMPKAANSPKAKANAASQ
jgi:hypothetical protein